MRLIRVSIFLFLIGCGSITHPHFNSTRFIPNYNIHIVNDDLQFYVITPSDLEYTQNSKGIKRSLSSAPSFIQQEIGKGKSVLLHAKTTFEPHYEFIVTFVDTAHASQRLSYDHDPSIIVIDTTMLHHVVSLWGWNYSPDRKKNVVRDFRTILSSLQIGPKYRKEIITPLDIADKYAPSTAYLAAYHELSTFPAFDRSEEQLKLQMMLTYGSFMENFADYDQLLNRFYQQFTPQDQIDLEISSQFISDSTAWKTLLEEAAKTNVVMINEQHFIPRHRRFTRLLLPRLKELGYTYLALEALGKGQGHLITTSENPLSVDAGFYVREPGFTQLIEEARAVGFTFIAYENFSHSERELMQARNLYEKTLALDSTAKVIVHAGVDHILERSYGGGKKWMAQIFKEKYGIDPLTIDQVQLDFYADPKKNRFKLAPTHNFTRGKLGSVDFVVLNELLPLDVSEGFKGHFKNHYNERVQLNFLKMGSEINDSFSNDVIPYRSMVVEKGSSVTVSLPYSTYRLNVLSNTQKLLESTLLLPTDSKNN